MVVQLPKLAANARNRAKTTKIKSGVLETPVILMPHLSTIGTRYGNSVSTAYASKTNGTPRPRLTRHCRNQREKPIRKFSIDPASSIQTSIADPIFRAACLQNEIAPKNFEIDTKNGLKKREQKTRKTIRIANKKLLAPLRPLKNISPALFNKI